MFLYYLCTKQVGDKPTHYKQIKKMKTSNNLTLATAVAKTIKSILSQPLPSWQGEGVNGWLLSSQTLDQLPTFGDNVAVQQHQTTDEEGWLYNCGSCVAITFLQGRVITTITITQYHDAYGIGDEPDPITVTATSRLKEHWES